jgi:hypothetical protein
MSHQKAQKKSHKKAQEDRWFGWFILSELAELPPDSADEFVTFVPFCG